MEKRYRVAYGHKGSDNTLYTDFISTAENAHIVAKAVAKGQDADWCVCIDAETGKEEILWDCM